MAFVNLTPAVIEKACKSPPAPGKTRYLREATGLAVRVQPTGQGTFVVFMPGGARPKVGRPFMHRPEPDALKEARAEAARKLRLRAEQWYGTPKSVIVRDAKPNTVEALVSAFMRHRDGKVDLKNYKQDESRFRRLVLPVWRERDVSSIRPKDVFELVSAVAEEGKPVEANRTLTLVKTCFNWGIGAGWLELNPAQRVMKPGGKEQARDRVLSDRELGELWACASTLQEPYGSYVKLLMLLPVRRTELAKMKWADLDLEKGEWKMPAKATKSRRAFVMPLPKPALELLLKGTQGGTWVFSTTGAGPIANFWHLKNLLPSAFEGTRDGPWVLHDLRRTIATGLASLSVRPDVVEACLNHTLRGVAGVYNRYDYNKEKKNALEKWARHLLAQV